MCFYCRIFMVELTGWAKQDTLFNQKPDENGLEMGKNWTTFNATD